MRLDYQPVTLDLRNTFRIAHGASDQRFNVITQLTMAEWNGYGEAAAVPYHGESQAGIIAYLAGLAGTSADPQNVTDPFLMDELLSRLPPGSQAAKASLDLALHDLIGQILGQPLYRLLGLNPEKVPPTSYTIAMDNPEQMAERARQSNWPILKIKLGSGNDEAMVASIRGATDARLRVDANAGWSREEAAWLVPRLAALGVEFIEQPLATGDIEGLKWLRSFNFGVPVFADESVKTSQDVARHLGAVDGVVIKLMKTGGIREALRAIHTARALDMQVMISCMVESSLGVTAAAHLAPLCDYVDLDGPLLIREDPFQGIRYHGAQIQLPERPGLGVQPAASLK
jgi:L-alanine-DL-glutamate epimerase-like enolase superfamily enzyme